VSGVAWVVAPTSLGAGVVAWGIWGVGGFVARRVHARWKKEGGDIGVEMRERSSDTSGLAREVKREGSYGIDLGPRAAPW
jgi:hypothetical protein